LAVKIENLTQYTGVNERNNSLSKFTWACKCGPKKTVQIKDV
jgi:hypothetical protein